MRVIFEKKVLEAAVDASMSCVSEKNAIPVVEGIRLRTEKNGKCSITTYDLEKGFRTEIPCRIEEPGNYIINAGRLLRIIRSMPDLIITVEVNENCSVTVTSGRSKFELHAMEGEAFPNLPELTGDRGFTVEGAILKKMIAQSAFAIATSNDARPMLCGAYFRIIDNLLRIVTCDGNRLALREMTCELGNKNKDGSALDLSFIVPGKTVSQLLRLVGDDESVAIYLTRKHVIFKTEGRVFFSRLIDINYIDYERVIPKTRSAVARFNRMDMIASLERAALVTEDRALGQAKSYLKCTFENSLLILNSVSTSGSVYDEVPINKDGDDMVMGINCRYLLDALKNADTDLVEAVLNGPLIPMILTPYYEKDEDRKDSRNYLYMVSPVKMKE